MENKEIEFSERACKAEQYFLSGYNCTQSVVLSFSDLIPIPKELLLNLASPFGGGMGRMREVCGTVSGMLIVLGCLRGYHSPEARQEKIDLYKEVRQLADKFREKNGSIVCRELLQGVPHTEGGIPEERTESYYKKRPCPLLAKEAAEILEDHLKEVGVL